MVRIKKLSPELEAQFLPEIKTIREFYFSLSMEERKELDRENDRIAEIAKQTNKTIKFCFECGKKINRIAKFCEFCGTKQIN